MQTFKFSYYRFILLIFLRYYSNKLKISHSALNFLSTNQFAVETGLFDNNQQLQKIINEMDQEPAIMLLNKYSLNLTLNWLCNVVNFPNVHKRLIIIVYDRIAHETLKLSWPKLNIIFWNLEQMHERFIVGDGRYQMFQLFRSRLCAYFAKMGRNFWMIQADTYWRRNLFEIIDTDLLMSKNENLLFDKEGSNGLLAEMIAGGNYYVKADERSTAYFDELARRLLMYYATDNNLMGALCTAEYRGTKCTFIPYRIISNWRWYTSNTKILPDLMQFDGTTKGESKFSKLQKLGARFVIEETLKPNQSSVCNFELSKDPMRAVSKEALISNAYDQTDGLFFVELIQNCFERIYIKFPTIRRFLKEFLFPYYAYLIT